MSTVLITVLASKFTERRTFLSTSHNLSLELKFLKNLSVIIWFILL